MKMFRVAVIVSFLCPYSMGAETAVLAGFAELYQPSPAQFQRVASVLVVLTPMTFPRGEPYVAFSDTDGRFSLEVPPGSYELAMTFNTHQLIEYIALHPGDMWERRYVLLPRFRYATYGYVLDQFTLAPIEGASLGNTKTDQAGFYFIYSSDFPFGTTWWSVSAPGYHRLEFMTRRESLLGISDFYLKPVRRPDHWTPRRREGRR